LNLIRGLVSRFYPLRRKIQFICLSHGNFPCLGTIS
jgi:hypothetical protein